MALVKVCSAVVLPLVVYCVCEPGLHACEWESWGVWSSCTRTCAGLRTRTRKMCCGVHVPDCIGRCRRPNTSSETEPCATHCPNGGSYIDGYCHCPPLRYGVCCERDETSASGDCARHCTWLNWLSWGDCSTNCGCGTRTRKRLLCGLGELSRSERLEDCYFRDDSTEKRVCTEQCTGNDQSRTCQLCSWNNWQPWNSCSQTCGGGRRSRSRSPCCCEGQTNKDCLIDCRLSENDSVQYEKCSGVCFNNGSFSNSICHCGQGYSGSCCADEVTHGSCTKCTWGIWGLWGPCSDSKNGEVTRRRTLCCRVGQNENECDAQCRRERHEAVDVKQCDLFVVRVSDSSQIHFMYTIIASVASIVLTSLVWTAAYCIRRKSGGQPDQQTSTDVNCSTEMDNYTSLHVDRNRGFDNDACESVYENPQDLFM